MKRQISLALLTISIFSLNIFPANAVEPNTTTQTTEEQNDSSVTNDGQWCVYLTPFGLLCWGL